jgi:hypothetical protein
VASGQNHADPAHPDLPTLSSLVDWLRTDWEHANVLDPGSMGVVGHSFGALLGARFSEVSDVGAFAGLSGEWNAALLDLLVMPKLLVWGGPLDFFTQVPDSLWNQLPPPKHRAVWTEGLHWDYLVGTTAPCVLDEGPCPALGAATTDLVTTFLGKYLPPECAIHLIDAIPNTLVPPELSLTSEQQFFAGGHLSSFGALEGQDSCELQQSADPWPLLANRRSKETHSRSAPCAWVHLIAPPNRRFVHERPDGYRWCDFCFPHLADG